MKTMLLLYLNVIGLSIGFIGGVLTVIYGMPNLAIFNTGGCVEHKETPEMRRYACKSRFGLTLITIGFALQLLSAIYNVVAR